MLTVIVYGGVTFSSLCVLYCLGFLHNNTFSFIIKKKEPRFYWGKNKSYNVSCFVLVPLSSFNSMSQSSFLLVAKVGKEDHQFCSA